MCKVEYGFLPLFVGYVCCCENVLLRVKMWLPTYGDFFQVGGFLQIKNSIVELLGLLRWCTF
ncbi:hypothetical protein LOK49_LG11G00752 [Camellia lanceoleosa]|uniref:Uncharacterized protein n=1 Tax=Camellia lanceoleosa TaxID=1840588 RepID=A0ACC0G0W1_9ERIC|nr:hypothetical protein LOK49_LG11G00752 [Camellia lanceoleosa]